MAAICGMVGRMKIVITGATGLIGWSLAPLLIGQGHDVVSLSRSGATGTTRWNPERKQIDHQALPDVEAVIHLAGENLAEGRWTPERKHALVASRVETTRWLVETLGKQARPPRIFICASAVGYYGNTGESLADESAPGGVGFLAYLCRQWEAEAWPAEKFGARVVTMRTGLILTPAGGALAKLLPIFRLGLGGRIGDGKQWMSWIALDDVLGAIVHLLAKEDLRGPVNLVAPVSVTNAVFAETLARVLRRPAVMVVPPKLLRWTLHDMADEALLISSRVWPKKLVESHFTHRWPDLEKALTHMLGR
jgi:uncharacterized protein